MAVAGNGNASRRVLIVDLDNFENRKHEVAKQLHIAASEVGFVSLALLELSNSSVSVVQHASKYPQS